MQHLLIRNKTICRSTQTAYKTKVTGLNQWHSVFLHIYLLNMIVGELPQFPASTTINRSNRLQNEGDRLETWHSASLHIYFPLSHAPLNLQPSPTPISPFQPISPPHRSCWTLQIASSAVRLFSAFTNARSFQQPYRPFTVCLRDPPPVCAAPWRSRCESHLRLHLWQFMCPRPFSLAQYSPLPQYHFPPSHSSSTSPLHQWSIATWFRNMIHECSWNHILSKRLANFYYVIILPILQNHTGINIL